MKEALSRLIAALILLVVAFLPPVVAAAEQNENVHFGEHLLVLLAGLLVAFAGESLIRHLVILDPSRAAWGSVIAGLGLILFVVSQVPAVDAVADAVMAIHMLQHLVILLSGGLMGTGLLVLSHGSVPTASSRSK